MRVWQVSGSVRSVLVVALLGGWGGALVSPSWAQELQESDELNAQPARLESELSVP